MSANDWKPCPRCARRARNARNEAVDKAAALYKKASQAEYEAAKAVVPDIRDALLEHNFRLSYEILVDFEGSGTVVVDFGGFCERCGLEVTFTYGHAIEGLDT